MVDVLIVEDDPMVAEINRGYLERTPGFRLAGIASDSATAREHLNGSGISLVLLDITMPGMDGLSFLREIRDSRPGVDVIMVTASNSSPDVQTALRLGIADYIVKPFTFERFQAALTSYLDAARLFRDADYLSQELLDKGILRKSGMSQQMPKGIDGKTLDMIRDTITKSEQEYKTGDLVLLTGLSRVSIKKYLDYLESTSCICRSLVYPPIGRPYSVYRWVGQKKAD